MEEEEEENGDFSSKHRTTTRTFEESQTLQHHVDADRDAAFAGFTSLQYRCSPRGGGVNSNKARTSKLSTDFLPTIKE